MKIKILITGMLLFSKLMVFGQYSGNAVINRYNSSSETNNLSEANRVYLSDSSFIIQANVLTNVIADSYVAIFGVSESAATIKEANVKIDDRIQKFVAAITTKMGISKSDVYVDMTTQTQIYDYKIKEKTAEQFLSGFEQKKNVIVKFANIKDLDKMVFMAADYGIYDLAKVDYVITDISKVRRQLFKEAMAVINEKKELYKEATNIKVKGESQIFAESFYNVYPSTLYTSYTPMVTEEVELSHYDYTKKELRKNTTYFYDHINYSGFDKVINPIVTEPAVECVLMLQIKFEIEKGKN